MIFTKRKTNICTLALFFALYFQNLHPQPQPWRFVQVNPANTILGIYFYDSLKGWYVTSGMNPDIGSTTNGGINWSITSLGSSVQTLNSVYFVNANLGWVVGSDNVIRKTTNGGINWLTQDNLIQVYNNSVHFSDTLVGIVCGQTTRASIIRTTDGGNTWSWVYSSLVPYSEIRSQYWLNHDTAWIAGGNILLKTTDCGITFQDYYGFFPPSSNGSNAFLDITFINENTGWVSGLNIDQKNLFITTNAGYNWTYQDNPIQMEGYTRQINGIRFLNENTGWAVSSALTIIKTTNRGVNWNTDFINSLGDEYYSIEKNLSNMLWVGATNGRLWYKDSINLVFTNNITTVFPKSFTLYNNYPNPFNSFTVIKYSINHPKTFINISIYNLLGQKVSSNYDKIHDQGVYEYRFNGSDLPSGVYFLRLQNKEGEYDIIKMLLLK